MTTELLFCGYERDYAALVIRGARPGKKPFARFRSVLARGDLRLVIHVSLMLLQQKQEYIMQIVQDQSREATPFFIWIRSERLPVLLEAPKSGRRKDVRDVFTTREQFVSITVAASVTPRTRVQATPPGKEAKGSRGRACPASLRTFGSIARQH
jgi:hypothetical protein